jgi:hypothetical protein
VAGFNANKIPLNQAKSSAVRNGFFARYWILEMAKIDT